MAIIIVLSYECHIPVVLFVLDGRLLRPLVAIVHD